MLIFFSAIALLFGGAVALSMAHRLLLQMHSRRWSATVGTITRSELYRAPAGSELSTEALITFSYTVNGIEYSSSQVQLGRGRPTGSDAEWQVRARRVGASVQVYYDPRSPSMSSLESGVHRGTVWALVISLLVAVCGAVGLW